MRTLWMFPLTFVAGVHGFALFAPYLLMILALMLAMQRRRLQPRRIPVAIPVDAQLAQACPLA